MEHTIYTYLWFFLIYAFLGWCLEVAFAALNEARFVNRGFLNGPICPIYGAGVCAVLFCLDPIKENTLVLFLGSVLVTTVLEFATGYILEKAFRTKWWDYSREKFNIMGYVCLKFSLAWGLACVFVIEIVHPPIMRIVHWLPYTPGRIILLIFLLGFAVDVGLTIATILKLNKRLAEMDELSAKIKEGSDAIGKYIADGAIEFKEKYEALAGKRKIGQDRLMKAFPDLSSQKYREHVEVLKTKAKSRVEENRQKRRSQKHQD